MDFAVMTVPARHCLIVGLGNPGAKYAHTRHNIGGDCVSQLAAQLSLRLARRAHGAVWGTTSWTVPAETDSAEPVRYTVTLARPDTFMNLNGHSVQRLCHALRIALSDLMVVHDHLDLPLGRIRLRPQGGAGGNNGMKSVIQQLGTPLFPRIAVGIGRPPGRMEPAVYVLRPFASAEKRDVVEPIKRLVAEALVYWVENDIDAAMNRYNGAL